MKNIFLIAGLLLLAVSGSIWLWPNAATSAGLPESLLPSAAYLLAFFAALLLFLSNIVHGDEPPEPELELKRIDVGRVPKVADIIFIHGLGGNAQRTWSHNGSAAGFWPAWLAAEYPQLAIWTLQYPTSISRFVKFAMTIEQQSAAISALLESLRSEGPTTRPLYFVAHSMGGILVKEMLRHAQIKNVYQELFKETSGIVFIGTPHKGSYLPTYLKRLKVAGLLRLNSDVQQLIADEPWLLTLDRWFGKFAGRTGTVSLRCYYETIPVRVWLWYTFFVVDPECAILDLNEKVCRRIPIGADHIKMCKPVTRSHPLYLGIKDFVETRVIPGGNVR